MQTEPIITGHGSALAPRLSHALVADVMHLGVMSVPADAELVTVARLMATRHIHAVVVEGSPAGAFGLISDLDLVAASRTGVPAGGTAGDYASTELVTVGVEEPLERAAQLMVEHQLAHLLVVGPEGTPVGVVSTLDVAGAIAWGES